MAILQDPYDIIVGVRLVGGKGVGLNRNKEKMEECRGGCVCVHEGVCPVTHDQK